MSSDKSSPTPPYSDPPFPGELESIEKALSTSRERYRLLVELAPDLIGVAVDQKIVLINPAGARMLGATEPAQLLGYPVLDLVHPDWRKQAAERICGLTQGQTLPLVEEKWLRLDGAAIDVQVTATPFVDQDGPAIQVVARDITARKRAEAALRKAERRLEGMLQTMVDGMVAVDLNGHIVYANHSAEQILGIHRDEIPGRNYADANWRQVDEHNQPFPLEQLPVATVLRERRAVENVEHGIILPDETVRWLSVNAAPLLDERNQMYGVVASFRDVTERQQTDQQLRRYASELERSNQELQDFAYAVSHDLQEPLRMVISYLQLLERRYKGQLDASADDFIAFAVDGALRMQTMIKDLLAYSRVDVRGKEFVPVDCEQILADVLNNLQLTIVESQAIVSHDPLPTVSGDPVQLTQLLQNLVGNAIKFHGQEPPRVHISAERDQDAWRFSVRDNGIGIDPRHFQRIFMVFQRLHTREEYEGTGIGLALCKRIVERHGGRIWVESIPAQGATFFFTIPLREQSILPAW